MKPFDHRRLKLLLCGSALMVTTWITTAAPILNTGNPLGFFTNVASRLLTTELNLNLTRIQIYPTNQYTPAVHRLLQVAANLYDATTNRTAELGKDYPTVFRPLFSGDASGNVFITGYTNVSTVSGTGDLVFSAPSDASAIARSVGANIPLNVYGVPWIIGAKKGFPNFNEISMESVVTLSRKMQVTRSDTTFNAILLATNVAYVFSISNSIGVEFWNSYTNDYTNALQVVVLATLTMNLTNEFGFSHASYFPIYNNSVINPWPGSTWNNNGTLNTNVSNPFHVPLTANVTFLSNSVYQWGGTGGFLPANNAGWQIAATDMMLPHFGLLTTNRLQALILVTDTNGDRRIIDYVHFSGPNSVRDLNAEIETHLGSASYNNMWDTSMTARGTPWGIRSQMGVSQNNPLFNAAYWGVTQQDRNKAIAEIDGFTVFMGGTPTMTVPFGYEGIFNAYLTNTTVQVPYTPTVTASEYTSWQANDPLIHHISSDLNFSDTSSAPPTGINVAYSPPIITSPSLLPNIGALNNRYQPWGRTRAYLDSINNPYNTAIKDPLVKRSDDWAFPSGPSLNPIQIGQVHRGTPWQTIYLKSTNILMQGNVVASGLNTWKRWTGITNSLDATNTAPIRDRHLVSLLTALLNTNDLASLFSVNNSNPNAWQALLNGLTAYTNLPGQSDAVLILSNSPDASLIASAIQSTRLVQPGHIFSDVGDILATPELAEKSPFLAGLNTTNQITDEAYEIIPSQLLSLLRADSIGLIDCMDSQSLVKFTGYDGHAYAIQASSNLVDWVSISTNCPANGVFSITNQALLHTDQKFYRSVLLH